MKLQRGILLMTILVVWAKVNSLKNLTGHHIFSNLNQLASDTNSREIFVSKNIMKISNHKFNQLSQRDHINKSDSTKSALPTKQKENVTESSNYTFTFILDYLREMSDVHLPVREDPSVKRIIQILDNYAKEQNLTKKSDTIQKKRNSIKDNEKNSYTELFRSNNELQSLYHYEYGVFDNERKTEFGHGEIKEGDSALRMYYVSLPDGRIQIVRYLADENGFKPRVTYQYLNNDISEEPKNKNALKKTRSQV